MNVAGTGVPGWQGDAVLSVGLFVEQVSPGLICLESVRVGTSM
jgi:hypothetical protein